MATIDGRQAQMACVGNGEHRWERRRDVWWFWVPEDGAAIRRGCSKCHAVERHTDGKWRDVASMPWWMRAYPAAAMIVMWVALPCGLMVFGSALFSEGPGLLPWLFAAPSWASGMAALALTGALIVVHSDTGADGVTKRNPQRHVGVLPCGGADIGQATPTNTQPRFHYWRDAGEYRWLVAVVAMAGIGWLVVGAARVSSPSQEGEVSVSLLMSPTWMVVVGFVTMVGAAAVGCIGVQHRQEKMTGCMSGVTKWGYGPDGQHMTVTHIRDHDRYPRRCGCELFHSDAEAQKAGCTYSDKVLELTGMGWSGFTG